MHGSLPKNKSSHSQHGHSVFESDNSIGDLFRDYGELYIKKNNISARELKLIRSIRVCRTPSLGGERITCKDCGHTSTRYFSCGNSQCPLCQGLKRMKWQENLRKKMLKVPYVHTIFTMPHELNGLAKYNKFKMYGLVMRSAWKTVKKLCAKEENLGALPGMTMVLHTFGSDLKYHIHVHCLITFGGLKGKKWIWPKQKKRLASYRSYCQEYRDIFMSGLKKLGEDGEIKYDTEKGQDYAYFQNLLGKKRWVVHSEYPMSKPEVITEYLAKYICRIGVSKERMRYDKVNSRIILDYKDYVHQEEGKAAPIATKTMHPLVAIYQILLHVLPYYFQKSRHCGLHHSRTRKRLEKDLPKTVKENGYTVRKIFEMMTIMLGFAPNECQSCGSMNFEKEIIVPDRDWIKPILVNDRAPPNRNYADLW